MNTRSVEEILFKLFLFQILLCSTLIQVNLTEVSSKPIKTFTAVLVDPILTLGAIFTFIFLTLINVYLKCYDFEYILFYQWFSYLTGIACKAIFAFADVAIDVINTCSIVLAGTASINLLTIINVHFTSFAFKARRTVTLISSNLISTSCSIDTWF